MKIYLASSWRNSRQPDVLAALRADGHEVYDFRNPAPGDNGFSWKAVHERPTDEWFVADYMEALAHPVAQRGFAYDMDALRWSEACVLVLPCGRSAHMEFGWAVGAGKRGLVLCESLDEPELMYLMAGLDPARVIVSDVGGLLSALRPPPALPEECDCSHRGPGNERRCTMEPTEGGGCDCACHRAPALPAEQFSGDDTCPEEGCTLPTGHAEPCDTRLPWEIEAAEQLSGKGEQRQMAYRCSVCGSGRIRTDDGELGACAFLECPDPMADYRREHPILGATRG